MKGLTNLLAVHSEHIYKNNCTRAHTCCFYSAHVRPILQPILSNYGHPRFGKHSQNLEKSRIKTITKKGTVLFIVDIYKIICDSGDFNRRMPHQRISLFRPGLDWGDDWRWRRVRQFRARAPGARRVWCPVMGAWEEEGGVQNLC